MSLNEADTILFSALSEVDFYSDEATAINDLNTEQIFEATVRCLKAITPEKVADISPKLSGSLMVRFAHCSELANICKELGLKGDIDYHTFLYGSAKQVRAVLSFLVQKLPKKSAPKAISGRDRFLCEFGSMLKQQLSAGSKPDGCQFVPFTAEPISLNSDCYLSKQLSSPDILAPSVLEWTALCRLSGVNSGGSHQSGGHAARGGIKVSAEHLIRTLRIVPPSETFGSKPVSAVSARAVSVPEFASAVDPDVTQSQGSRDSPEAAESGDSSSSSSTGQQQRVQELQNRLEKSRRRFQRGRDRLLQLQETTDKISLDNARLSGQLEEKRSELKLVQAARQLLQQPEQAEQLLARARQRLSRHREQWEERSRQLGQQLEQLVSPLERLQTERSELQRRVGEKQQQLKELVTPGQQQLSRSFYLRRIGEISVTARQQRAALRTSRDQLHALRQQLSSSRERLERAFSAAQQLVYKDALESSWSATVYRSLSSLHDTNVQLVETAERTGAISRQVQRLQLQIDLERASGVEENFARLTRDLEAMVDQNTQLQQQLNLV